MAIYRYSIKGQAAEGAAGAAPRSGPFLVEASDQVIGGRLLDLNFGRAMGRLLEAAGTLGFWTNAEASDCVPLADGTDGEALRQRREVAGVDIAAWFLVRPALEQADGRYARMLRWPLGPDDRCPA
jgi:hypothetical protein